MLALRAFFCMFKKTFMTSYTMFDFQATLRLRNDGKQTASRHFITVPKDIADPIRDSYKSIRRKGVSIPIQARVGFLTRNTSMFYSKHHQTYILPIKADIRKQLRIKTNDHIYINITIL